MMMNAFGNVGWVSWGRLVGLWVGWRRRGCECGVAWMADGSRVEGTMMEFGPVQMRDGSTDRSCSISLVKSAV